MTAPAIRPIIDRAQIAALAERLGGGEGFDVEELRIMANRLRWPQQMQLVEHAHGPRTVSLCRGKEVQTMNALVAHGLVRPMHPGIRPTHTVATELGRAVIAYLLGRWADVLAQLQEGEG